MDKIIGGYPCVPFGELNYCPAHGVAYQPDTSSPVEYGEEYFEKYVSYEGTDVARRLNSCRAALARKYCGTLLDVGIGSGEFVRLAGGRVYGFDINPVARQWLQERGLWADPYERMPEDVEGITLWDTLEHIPEPTALLDKLRPGMYAFVALPVFGDLTRVRFSKHYRPNEHYYYFSADGLVGYFRDAGFTFVELSDGESRAGRENILSFVFRKNVATSV